MQLTSTHNQRALPALRRYAPHFALTRAALYLFAHLSDGIATGVRHGFDSSAMLDYVYRNQPTGRGAAGRLIDRIYLNQLGWRAIRSRTALLQRHVRTMLVSRRERGLHTHLLDVAAGLGRLHLALLAELGGDDIHLTCYDQDRSSVEQGRRLAAELGLSHRVYYERGDATNLADLAHVSPPPNIVVACGIYEILTDDAAVCCSLRGIQSILAPGGTLLFTTQVAHPQRELIANVLTNRSGEPLLLGTRTLARVERWAREAGFSGVGSELESCGLFGVTQCTV